MNGRQPELGGSSLGPTPRAPCRGWSPVWEVWVRLDDTPAWLLPSPSAIGRGLIDDRALLARHGWVTLAGSACRIRACARLRGALGGRYRCLAARFTRGLSDRRRQPGDPDRGAGAAAPGLVRIWARAESDRDGAGRVLSDRRHHGRRATNGRPRRHRSGPRDGGIAVGAVSSGQGPVRRCHRSFRAPGSGFRSR